MHGNRTQGKGRGRTLDVRSLHLGVGDMPTAPRQQNQKKGPCHGPMYGSQTGMFQAKGSSPAPVLTSSRRRFNLRATDHVSWQVSRRLPVPTCKSGKLWPPYPTKGLRQPSSLDGLVQLPNFHHPFFHLHAFVAHQLHSAGPGYPERTVSLVAGTTNLPSITNPFIVPHSSTLVWVAPSVQRIWS